MISVRDLVESPVLIGSSVVGGGQSLDNSVSWVTRPRPTPPAFADLRGGEMILLDSATLTALDERTSLERVVRELAALEAVAVAVTGRISPAARNAADGTGIVLVQLPGKTDLSAIERDAKELVTRRSRDSQRRHSESGRKLMELAIAGESLEAIVKAMAELAGHSVVFESRDGRILALALHPRDGLERADCEAMIRAGRETIAGWLRGNSHRSPAEPPVATYPLAGAWQRAVAPALGGDGLLGSISLISDGQILTVREQGLVSHGAAACAVVLVRESATMAARREIAVNLLDEILDGALRNEATLHQAARRLHYDLEGQHVVFVCRLEPTGQTAIARAREHRWQVVEEILLRREARLLWRVRNNSAEILWPVADASEARKTAALLYDQLRKRSEDSASAIVVGMGQTRAGLSGIRRSHQEAKQALTTGRRLHGVGGLTRFEDLGVYRLIFAAEHLPELAAFHDEALSTLVAYDRAHGGDLIQTLKAFFDANCGPKEAAGLLDVHRNTVLYRLQRIQEITGLNLDAADVRLRLHLALCVHLALYAGIE